MLSALYGRLAIARRAWYERRPDLRRKLHRPVISVGNLVAGGSGKTPVVAALARLLLEAGERPAILSRGYARRSGDEGVIVVSDGNSVLEPVQRSGDEPQMLARALGGVPVLVSADRYLAGTLAERRFASTVMLLDDGFQHLQLAREVDLLIVNASDLDESPYPSGRLREPLTSARAADAVLVFGSADDAARVSTALGVEPVFTAHASYGALQRVNGSGIVDSGFGIRDQGSGIRDQGSGMRDAQVLAVAGIARASRFFAALREQGLDVRREITFPDHHWFTLRDLERVARDAREVSADLIVTTEKDAVRLRASESTWVFLPMNVTIEPSAKFASWLQARLAEAGGEGGACRAEAGGEGG